MSCDKIAQPPQAQLFLTPVIRPCNVDKNSRGRVQQEIKKKTKKNPILCRSKHSSSILAQYGIYTGT